MRSWHIKRTGTDVRQPIRVVFDRQARLPLDSQLLRTLDQSPVLVVVAPEADASALREAGAEVLVADGIEAALADLGRRGITVLFLEGGRTLAAAFQPPTSSTRRGPSSPRSCSVATGRRSRGWRRGGAEDAATEAAPRDRPARHTPCPIPSSPSATTS